MTVSVSQLVKCPRCGHRFELSETFRAHYEQEKQAAVADAVHHMSVKAEAAGRARGANPSGAQEQRERRERAAGRIAAGCEQQLPKSRPSAEAHREELLQAQLRATGGARRSCRRSSPKSRPSERSVRQEEIRAEAATAAQARLAEATKLGEDLQAQLQEIQAAQAANEARIREEAEAREQNLLTQLQQTQAEYAQQEALIRADEEARCGGTLRPSA